MGFPYLWNIYKGDKKNLDNFYEFKSTDKLSIRKPLHVFKWKVRHKRKSAHRSVLCQHCLRDIAPLISELTCLI